MPVVLTAEKTFVVGNELVLEGASPRAGLAAVFEDDGNTGYFYAVDMSDLDNPIQDTLHIYNVQGVTDRHIPSKAQIVWSAEGTRAALLINGYPHAAFDFAGKRGYCRTGFPPHGVAGKWPQPSHAWDDAATDWLRR